MASFRRALPAAGVLRPGRAASSESGRAASLLAASGGARSGVSPFKLSSGSHRSMSDGGSTRSPLRQAWDSSYVWFSEKRHKYAELKDKFKEADDTFKTMLQLGSYVYVGTGLVFSGLIYLVDCRIYPKIDERCKPIENNAKAFHQRAVSDFLENKSKMQNDLYSIQSDVNKLRQKMMDNKEDEVEHRQQLFSAENFLKLNGYLVVSNEEFSALVRKVEELEMKTSKQADSVGVVVQAELETIA